MNRLLRLAGVAVMAASLGNCALMQKITNPLTQTRLDTAAATYGLVLAGVDNYAHLPVCAKGATISLTNPCHAYGSIATLKRIDAVAEKALSDAQTFIDQNPTVDASTIVQAAIDAVANARSAALNAGVTIPTTLPTN